MITEKFVQEIRKLALDAAAGVQSAPHTKPFTLLPDGLKITELPDSMLEKPWRLKQTVSVHEPDSFITYFKHFYEPAVSRLFVDADWQKPQIVGILDYHLHEAAGTSGFNEPAWGEHKVFYQFRHTPEWKAWSYSSAKDMNQADFAQFIEDNIADVTSPAPANLLQVSRSMQAKKDVDFAQATRLQNGEVQFTYNESIRGVANQGAFEVPEIFTISISPFQGVGECSIDCRLRYRISSGGLSMRYQLIRPHKVIQAKVDEIVQLIAGGLPDAPMTFGLPGLVPVL